MQDKEADGSNMQGARVNFMVKIKPNFKEGLQGLMSVKKQLPVAHISL